MSAFSDKRFDQLTEVVRRLATRALVFRTSNLTHADLLNLFVPAEDHAAVNAGKKLFGLTHTGFRIEVGDPTNEDGRAKLVVCMNTNAKHKGFPFPRYMGEHFIQEDSEAVERLNSWVSWRLATGREWGLVQAVLNALNQRCRSPEEVRFFFPGVLALLPQCRLVMGGTAVPDPKGAELADKLRPFKVPTTLASVSQELKDACTAASTSIARVGLLPDHEKEPPKGFQQVRLSCEGYGLAELPWTPGAYAPQLNTDY
jgi:hypothetical protein